MKTNKCLLDMVGPLGVCMLKSAPRITIYDDPVKRSRALGNGVPIKFIEEVGTHGILKRNRYYVWLEKKNEIHECDILERNEEAEERLRESMKWVLHRFDRLQAAIARREPFVNGHGAHVWGSPEEIQVSAWVELDYLEKLKKAVDIAIEVRKVAEEALRGKSA